MPATHGREAILPCNDLGHEGAVQGLIVGDAFFNRPGASVAEKSFCGSGPARLGAAERGARDQRRAGGPLPARHPLPEEPRLPQLAIRQRGAHDRPQGEQAIPINPSDASGRRMTEGALVRVFNDRVAFHGAAKVTEDVPPGAVVASLGYWHSLHRDGAVNVISSSKCGGMGHSPTFSDNLVEVGLAAG